MQKVAIVGASGFAGAELMRICAAHPEFEVIAATGDSSADTSITDLYPHLGSSYGSMKFTPYAPDVLDEADLVFLSLPSGKSLGLMPEILSKSKRVVDLSGDFRFSDVSVYEQWYGTPHSSSELLDRFVFGLPELFGADLEGAETIAVAGCYVTAASLALAPLVAAGVVQSEGIVVDAASGVSGAGRAAKPATSFATVDQNFTAYGLVDHRHTPEMEMAIATHSGTSATIIFTPHLAPMTRGILATCYARTEGTQTTSTTMECLGDYYNGSQFVQVDDSPPSTKTTLGSNNVKITARVDDRTGWTVVIAALDNLVKGAAGQAVQCANLSLGMDEATGLTSIGLYP